MNKLICGIDPGIKGGICLLNEDGYIPRCEPIPICLDRDMKQVDFWEASSIIETADIIYIEQLGTYSHDGRVGSVTMGINYGILLGVIKSLEIPFHTVSPRDWQRIMLAGIPKTKNKKGRSIIKAKQLQPDRNWLESNRCRSPHDGMIEAYLIAEYGRILCRAK